MYKLLHNNKFLFLLSIPKQDQEISPCFRFGLSLPGRGHVLVRCSYTLTGLRNLFPFLQYLDLLWNYLVPIEGNWLSTGALAVKVSLPLSGPCSQLSPGDRQYLLDQAWAETGPGLDQDWAETGPGLDQEWAETGPGLDQDRTNTNSYSLTQLQPIP